MFLFILLFIFNFFLSLFTYFERDRDSTSGGGGRAEREGERNPSRLRAVSLEPDVGLELTKHEIGPELKASRTLNRLSHPGAPSLHELIAHGHRCQDWSP